MKRPNTTTVLLAVVALLLGLNLLHDPAKAQPQVQVPERVTGLTVGSGSAFRVWSDGVVEWRGINQGFPIIGDYPYWLAGSAWAEVPVQP